jgi:ubiquitin-activating enzyme E1
MVAGKIIPAIATTTAGIVGLVSLQLYTLSQSNDITFLRDCNINLTYNHFTFSSPISCEYIKKYDNSENIIYIPENFTIWDFIEIKNSMNIKELIDYIYKEYNVNIESISINNLNLYELNSNNNHANEKIEDVYNKILKMKLFDKKRILILDII